ncbi:hypothetical protein [Streptomyces sp. NEAU-174]|uniref:hypothetical protein n=1 Tax=Streptomyces sp. NEAU-174 TaxID=3458254 RepID=UPI004043D399
MGQQKIPAAIVGPGNIGTDLLAKLAHSPVIDVRYVVGIVESDGLARARTRGIEASAEGVDWARARFEALVAEIGDEAWVGYHGHQNMSLGVTNSVIAHEAGVRYIDGSLCALGAGAGDSPTEVLGAVFDRLGVATGLDAGLLLDAAEEVVRPYLSRWPKMDRNAIVQGWAGVYSSFLLHAERAAERYKVPAHAILRRCGERGCVGGQEDMIIDIAIGPAEEQTT